MSVININYGHNEHLMQGCETLSQYAQFVAVTREYANKYANLQIVVKEIKQTKDSRNDKIN